MVIEVHKDSAATLKTVLRTTSEALATVGEQIAELEAKLATLRSEGDADYVALLEEAAGVSLIAGQITETEGVISRRQLAATLMQGDPAEEETAARVQPLQVELASLKKKHAGAARIHASHEAAARTRTSEREKEQAKATALLDALKERQAELETLHDETHRSLGQSIFREGAEKADAFLAHKQEATENLAVLRKEFRAKEREWEQSLADGQQDYDALRSSLPWQLAEWPDLARQLREEYGLPEAAKRPAPVNEIKVLFDRHLENVEFIRIHSRRIQHVIPVHRGLLIELLSLPPEEVAVLLGGSVDGVEDIVFSRRNRFENWLHNHPFDERAW